MKKVQLVTDSTADIPKEVREKLNIEVVPLTFHFGNETYVDSKSLNAYELFAKMEETSMLPTTSQPSPVEFIETYKRLLKDGETEIISVHLSSALSGTYQSACLAKDMLGDDVNITVIDSKSASYGIGMLVVAAAEAAKNGKSKEECLQLIEDLMKHRGLYFLLDTLEYLQKGGRIGKAAALVGSLLNIKPILSIDVHGEVIPVEKVRGQKKAMNRIAERLVEEFGDRKLHVTMGYTKDIEPTEQLFAVLKQQLNIQTVTYTLIGPVIATHTGPGASAVFVYQV